MDIKNLLDDFLQLADQQTVTKGIWREQPVDLVSFFKGKEFLNEKPFQGKQTELLEATNSIIWYKLTGETKYCPEELRKITEEVVLFGKGCLHGDSRIFDVDTGLSHKVRDLAIEGKPFNLKAMDTDTQKLVSTETLGVVPAGKGDIYEVITNSGRRIKVFKEHIFLSRKYTGSSKGLYKGTEWRKLEDMSVGDYIAIQNKEITQNGVPIDKNEARLIGYLIGNGNISDAWKCMFYTPFKEVEEDYCKILKYFGVEPVYPRYANEERPDRDCVAITCGLPPGEAKRRKGNPITLILRKYGLQGCNAYNKHLPEEVLNADKESIIEFLRALYATDGWVCMINKKIPQIGYSSVSIALIKDLQYLLSKIGIHARIDSKKTKSNFGVSYTLSINSEVGFLKFCKQVSIIGKEEKQREIVSFIESTRDINRAASGKRLDTDILFERIKEINLTGEDTYYDLTVPVHANYVAEGFVNHNSGKDFLASGIMAYMCYILNCMSDPHRYFDFGQDEPIDLINVAINANQANNVFFKKLKARLRNCKWFTEVMSYPTKYNEFQVTKNQIRFYRNVTAHSAHSEAEAYEGFNPLVVILDEYGGYEPANAEKCYDVLRSSAVSRYNDKMLMIFISYARSQNCPMYQKFLEAGIEGNEHIYAIRGKSWEVNPNISRDSLQPDYDKDPVKARTLYECEPPNFKEGLFSFPERIDEVTVPHKFSQHPGLVVEEHITTRLLNSGEQRHFIGLQLHNLILDPQYTYYIGGDCGVTGDSYCISVGHGEPVEVTTVEGGESVTKMINKPVEDLILEWHPSKKDRLPVDLLNVADILEYICSMVYVKKAIFDKFNSAEVVQRLVSYGVEAEDKAFSNPFQVQIYQNLKSLIYSGNIELLDYLEKDDTRLTPNEELKALKLINGNKIDHDLKVGKKKGSKDISDARAGFVWVCSTDEPEGIDNYSLPIIAGARRL